MGVDMFTWRRFAAAGALSGMLSVSPAAAQVGSNEPNAKPPVLFTGGVVKGVSMETGPVGRVFFWIDGATTCERTAAQPVPQNRFIVSKDDKASVALLMLAFAAGKPVRLYFETVCVNDGDSKVTLLIADQ